MKFKPVRNAADWKRERRILKRECADVLPSWSCVHTI